MGRLRGVTRRPKSSRQVDAMMGGKNNARMMDEKEMPRPEHADGPDFYRRIDAGYNTTTWLRAPWRNVTVITNGRNLEYGYRVEGTRRTETNGRTPWKDYTIQWDDHHEYGRVMFVSNTTGDTIRWKKGKRFGGKWIIPSPNGRKPREFNQSRDT